MHDSVASLSDLVERQEVQIEDELLLELPELLKFCQREVILPQNSLAFVLDLLKFDIECACLTLSSTCVASLLTYPCFHPILLIISAIRPF